MISPRWRKVLRDLWNNKTRTLLVVLSIAVGVAAIGMVASSYIIITRELPASFALVNPASARIRTMPFQDDLLTVLRSMDVVREVEGRYNLRVRMQVGQDNWKDIDLYVIPDFNNIQINKIWHEDGQWPPGKGELIIERASLILTQSDVGDSVLIQTPNGEQREMKIVGLAHDLNSPAGTFTNQATGYIIFESLEMFGYANEYNELLVTVNGDGLDRVQVRNLVNQVQSKVEKSGRTIYGTLIPDPGRHWFESYLTPMAAILGVIGLIILLLSGLLVINTTSALLAQQVKQIGIMKSVGARTYQIFMLYEFSMLLIGVMALVIAVPLGILGARAIVQILTGIINFDIMDFSVPQQILIVQILLSIFIPILVAFVPIISGSRITVHQAISDYGLSKSKFGDSLIDRLLRAVRGLPRPLLLSLRNTFRKKTRLALTIVALALGSGIFIAVFSVYAGLLSTLDEALSYYKFDVAVQFGRPYRIEQIMNEVVQVPGVASAETWGVSTTRIRKPDGSESNSILFLAPPTGTELINPILVDGSWLDPEDEDAVVINTEIYREKPDVKVGDELVLNIRGDPTSWEVVGIVRSVMTGPVVYTHYPNFSRMMGSYGLADSVYIATDRHDPLYQNQIAESLENHFENAGMNVASTGKVAELRATAVSQFNVIFLFLLLMALLLSGVGGFGLAGTMSLNVLERTREIGVMRAIGASNGTVMRIVIIEGILIGVISWFFGTLLAIPLSLLLGNIMGSGFLQSELNYTYSTQGALLWLAVVVVIATLASYFPARNATRLSVHTVLAYE